MNTQIQLTRNPLASVNKIVLISEDSPLDQIMLKPEELTYLRRKMEQNEDSGVIEVNRFDHTLLFVVYPVKQANADLRLEKIRQAGAKACQILNKHRFSDAMIIGYDNTTAELLALAEGITLANYQFLKHYSNPEQKRNTLSTIFLPNDRISRLEYDRLVATCEAVAWARNLVNEPLNALNAEKLAESFVNKLQPLGVAVEVMHKNHIEALGMGGLLAVNSGSIDPPTFTVMQWKPSGCENQKPIVLVGKGVVYDTGGMSLKPANAMDTMKCDMAGSAAVAATMYVVARLKLQFHVVALTPATDNRVNGNAYVPGDVITMFDGTTVEVISTDAEGRLILADALSYAKKFDPQLVITVATLTGSAKRAIGPFGIAAMQAKADSDFAQLKQSGNRVYERLVEFPMWDEYREQIKSDVADLKNIGGPEAGMITAGKFLEHFTENPFIHLDIAGPAFLEKHDSYRGKGGTGVCVRLLANFLENKSKQFD